MTTKPFVVSEFRDLLVMQRIFREAKFCTEADDDELSDSPIVAELFGKLLESLIESEVQLRGERARENWEQWLAMSDPRRAEWQAAISRAKKKNLWSKWTEAEKNGYVRILFSPFILDVESTRKFIKEVTAHFLRNEKTNELKG